MPDHPLQLVINDMASALGIAELKLDSLGTCSVVHDKEFTISVIAPPLHDFVYIAAPIGTLSPGNSETHIRLALALNYMLLETGGAAIGLNENDEQLILTARYRAETMTGQQLATHLHDLAVSAVHIREKFSTEISADTAIAPDQRLNDLNSDFIFG